MPALIKSSTDNRTASEVEANRIIERVDFWVAVLSGPKPIASVKMDKMKNAQLEMLIDLREAKALIAGMLMARRK